MDNKRERSSSVGGTERLQLETMDVLTHSPESPFPAFSLLEIV